MKKTAITALLLALFSVSASAATIAEGNETDATIAVQAINANTSTGGGSGGGFVKGADIANSIKGLKFNFGTAGYAQVTGMAVQLQPSTATVSADGEHIAFSGSVKLSYNGNYQSTHNYSCNLARTAGTASFSGTCSSTYGSIGGGATLDTIRGSVTLRGSTPYIGWGCGILTCSGSSGGSYY